MKFKVGEICEVRSANGRYLGWREVEIVQHLQIGDTYICDSGKRVPFMNKDKNNGPFYVLDTGRWTFESQLRKKFLPPKDQWDVAEDDFITWLNQRLLKGVIVGSIEIRGQPL
jgi:hypothetical protein